MDLADARQRVHDDHPLLGARHQLGRDLVLIFHGLVLRHVYETFFLYAGHIEHVGVFDHIGHVVRLAHGDARVDHLVHDHQRQAQQFRRHEAQCDVVLRQQFGQRVHCASVAQIAHHRDLEAIDTA